MAGQAQDYGRNADGSVWVRGPWEVIQPSRDVDEVIDQLCPAVLALPRATLKDYGQEYCGAIYTIGDGVYFASKPSPLGRYEAPGPSKSKNCFSPFHVIIQKLVPNRNNSRPGEVYERRSKSWVLIGIIEPEDKPYGKVTYISAP